MYDEGIKPKAQYYSLSKKVWVCFACMQKVNQYHMRNKLSKDVITHQEVMMKVLKGELELS